jgi:hypothetical protein
MREANHDRCGGVFALLLVFVGAAGFAASLTTVYRGMRNVMLESGGFCASGGPYQINPGQVCSSGQGALLIGGVVAGLVFAGILIAGSGWYGGGRLAGVGLLLWAALFGALGWNFLQLGFDPPAQMNGAIGWIVSGVVFWLMALGGLIPGLISLASYFKNADRPPAESSSFREPLVRANVEFTRTMPGDPAFGSSNPGSPPPAGRATSVASEFIDPVTGERHGGGND